MALLLKVVARRLYLSPRFVHYSTDLLALRGIQLKHSRHSLERPFARQLQQAITVAKCAAGEANRQPGEQSDYGK